MAYVGFFLLSWLIVGFLVALVVGRVLREHQSPDEKPPAPVWHPERRVKLRRASDRGAELPWHQVDQRCGFGRRHTDRPRKVS